MDQDSFNWGSVDPFLLLDCASSHSTGKEREKDIMVAVKHMQGVKAGKTEALGELLDIATTFSMAPIFHYGVRFPKTSGKKKCEDRPAKVKRDTTISSPTQEPSTSNLRCSSRASKGAKYKELVSEGLLVALKFKDHKRKAAESKPQGAKRPRAE